MFRRRQRARAGDDAAGTTMIPGRERRRGVESVAVRLIATGGIIGIGTALAAILGSQDVHHWITGVVVATVSVILAAVLWSSRML